LLDVIADAEAYREEGRPLMAAHLKRLLTGAFKDHWVLDWLSQLRRPAFVPTGEWVLDRGGHLMDPSRKLWYLEEPLAQVQERAVQWAEKNDVRVIRGADITDVGFERRLATGIELKGQNKFLPCDQVVFCFSLWSMSKQKFAIFPKLGLKLSEIEPVAVWVKCRFSMRKGSRPQGMEKVSSLVGDPFLPYSYSNLLLLNWFEDGEKKDELVVWCKVQYSELLHRSYLVALCDQVKARLGTMIPMFTERTLEFHPFEEVDGYKAPRFDDRPFVRKSDSLSLPFHLKMKNVFFAAPENDRGFELLSALASELRVYDHFKKIALKKEQKRDRKIHSSRNGKDLVNTKPV
jgi:hypothetical protein